MNKLNLLPIRQVFFALIAACVFYACTNEPDQLGLNLTPQGDKLNNYYTDTTTVIAFNLPTDTLRTSILPGYSGSSYPNILFGAIYDSAFGKVEAGFATQLWLSTTSPTISANPTADSVVLQLPYAGLFGDSTSTQTMKIYELGEALRGDSAYYSNRIVQTGALLYSATFKPDVKDSVTINSLKYEPMLRVKLDNSFGNKILNGGAYLINQEEFRKLIKGLYVTTTAKDILGQGSILTFNLTGTNAGIQVYYHTPTDSGSLSVYVNAANSQRFNTFNNHKYQFADPLLKAMVLSKDSTKGKQKLFLSGMHPTEIKITFPNILKYQSKQRAGFNQALLVIDAPWTTVNNYPPPSLSLVKVYTDKMDYAVEDLPTGTASTIDGVYDTITKQYRFAITQYLQNILKNGVQNYYLKLAVGTPGQMAPFLVIPGTANSKKRFRLELIYTTQK